MVKRELPKHIYRQKNGLYFQRRGWPSQKIQSKFGTPDFWKEYADILSGRKKPKVIISRNFKALIKDYIASHRYKKLKPRTARDYEKYLDFFSDILGEANPAKFQRKDAIRLRDSNADKPYFANYAVKVMRVLMEHCIDIGWRTDNPVKGVSLIKVDSDPRDPWPEHLIEAYRATNPLGSRERLVMELSVGIGQRIADTLKMKWSDIKDSGIEIRQNKTGKPLWVPILPPLQEALDATEKRSVFIVTNYAATGPWSYRGASQAIRKAREAIGALGYDIHSWRYNAACELLVAGCSDELIGAVTGQSPAMVQHYTAKVRQKVFAIEAQKKRSKHS